MFKRIFVEKELTQHPRVQHITQQFPNIKSEIIDSVSTYFGRTKKPYLHKRQDLNLFLGQKKGQLVKEAPVAYGVPGEPHYYFVHAYNCVYECAYCYLQGYFNSPDIVLFLNHEDILQAMAQKLAEHPNQNVWFHAGEFSDSLALNHLTKEWDVYFEFFQQHPQAWLELRTKSAQIDQLLKLKPAANTVVSYSLSPPSSIKRYDYKTASYQERLQCLQQLEQKGYPLALHFDPIMPSENTLEQYHQLLSDLEHVISLKKLQYLSLGVVRFAKESFLEVQRNYPHSPLLTQEWTRGADGKVRLLRPYRLSLLKSIQKLCLEKGMREEQVYLCMEDDN